MAWLPLVLVGLLGEIWVCGPLAGVVVLVVAAWWLRDRRVVGAGAVFAVAVVYGASPLPAVVAFAGAALPAAHDVHARRPGAWFPLLVLGLVLAATTLEVDHFTPAVPDLHRAGAPGLSNHAVSVAVVAVTDHTANRSAARALSTAVAVVLVRWAWRARDVLPAAVAAVYLAAAWYVPGRSEPVVLAGAAVAVARTAAPAVPARTAGRWTGRPGRWPGP